MNEHEKNERAQRIVRILNESVDNLDRDTCERLASARRAALARAQFAPISSLAWAGQAFERFTETPVFGIRYFIPIAGLVFGLMSAIYWQQNVGPWSEMAEIDAALLTDELPPTAFLDKGFDAWLKRLPQ